MTFDWAISATDLPRSVLISGASGSIGAALAQAYAAPGVTLILQGRDAERLNAVGDLCRSRGASVQLHVLDLANRPALQQWVQTLNGDGGPDLVIANAGQNTHVGPQGQAEPWADVESLLEVNLRAVIALVQGVLPAMRARRRGQIALVSSLAGFFGLPMTPAYSASKAGVKAYGEALRGWLAPEGIAVSVILTLVLIGIFTGIAVGIWILVRSVMSLLNGPVINSEGRSDVVATQQQVDDLLGSLGF